MSQTKNPRRSDEPSGGFVLPNRVTTPIVRGIQEDVLLLLEEVFVDVIADDRTDDRGNHTHNERNERTLHV